MSAAANGVAWRHRVQLLAQVIGIAVFPFSGDAQSAVPLSHARRRMTKGRRCGDSRELFGARQPNPIDDPGSVLFIAE